MAGWPWPLDGVQHWFESLWNWIGEAATNAVRPVQDWINNGLAWLKDRILEGVSGLWTSISTAFDTVKTWITDGLKGAVDTITKGVTDLGSSVSTWITDGLKGIGDSLRSWGEDLSKAFGDGVKGLSDGLSNVYTGLSTAVSDGINTLSTAFDGAMATVGSWVSDALSGVASALGSGFQGFMNWFISGLQSIGVTLANGLKGLMEVVNAALSPIIIGFVDMLREAFSFESPDKKTQEAVDKMVKQTQERLIKELKAAYKSPFNPTKVIATSLAVAGLVLTAQVGVHGASAAAGLEVLGSRIDLTDVVESAVDTMGLNRVVGSAFLMPLDVGLFTPLRYAYNQMFTPYVPPVQDLIRFVVREVITPQEFQSAMPLHGFSSSWATAYWEAHWVLPAFGNLVDAYHRGKITEGDLSKFMVWHDYSPTARPGTSKSDLEIMRGVVKTLIGRVDLRRGYALGAITLDGLVERFRWLGYEEDAPLIAEITAREALDAEIGKLRDNAKADFIKGYIKEEDLRRSLKDLGYGPDIVEYYVQDAIQDRQRSHFDSVIAYLVDAYVKNYIKTEDELETELSKIIVVPDVVALTVSRAYIQKHGKVKAG